MKMMRMKRKGFTLVEVLIVVIIIAVLAALILPKLMTQSENAYIGGAERTLGMLRRAQLNARATNGAYVNLSVANSKLASTEMKLLGLAPLPAGDAFDYSCDAAGLCQAARSGRGEVITLSADAGTWCCTSGTADYVEVSTGTAKGCKAS